MTVSCAFCVTTPLRFAPSPPVLNSPRRHPARRGRSPRASTLLAVELAALSAAASSSSGGFSQTLSAARGAGGAPYLLYVAEAPREAVLGAVEAAGLPPGDAVSAAGGVYQRGYVTPDPLWARKCWGAWDQKPTRWVAGNFFEGRVKEREGAKDGVEEEMEMVFDLVEGGQEELMGLRDEIEGKMVEMGVAGNVGLRGGSGDGGCIVVRAAGAPVGEVVQFCANMLGVSGQAGLCAFGSGEFVEASMALHGEGAVGIVPSGEAGCVSEADGIFASVQNGEEALLDGLAHHGVLK